MSQDLLQLSLFHWSVPQQGSPDVTTTVCRARSGDTCHERGVDHVDQRRVQVQPGASRATAGWSAGPQHAAAGPRSQVGIMLMLSSPSSSLASSTQLPNKFHGHFATPLEYVISLIC